MSAQSKLQQVQSALVNRGVKDVKFYFVLSGETPHSEVANDAAEFLEAYLDESRHTVLKVLGDAPRN